MSVFPILKTKIITEKTDADSFHVRILKSVISNSKILKRT